MHDRGQDEGRAYLENVRAGTGDTAGDGLDESGDFTHHIDTVQALAQRAVDLGGDVLTIGSLAGPLPLDGGGLGPLALGVLLCGGVGDLVVGASVNNLAVLEDAADSDLGRAVGWGGGELHHDSGEGRGLEVKEVPAGSYNVLA
jgi:hypothetical protein